MKIFNVARSDKNEILTNVFRSKGVLVGTSTMNNVMMPKIAGLVEEMTGLRFRNKRASAFGSHGWSGGAVDRLSTRLQDAGFEMSLSLKAKWRPDQDALELCREHGREIARQWALAPLPQSTVNTVVKEETSATTTADLGPRMQCSVCQWIYDPAKGEPMQDVAPERRGVKSRITSCARNAPSAKTSLTNWHRRQNEQRHCDHWFGLRRPPTGEKYSQTGRQYSINPDCRRQHG